jgi:hypothetical protein
MIKPPRTAAEQLFKRPEPADNTVSAKLLQFRRIQAWRNEQAREDDLKERMMKRARVRTSGAPFFAA